jgi:hypothetical protein
VKSFAPTFIWRHCWSIANLVGINLRKCGSFSYWFDNLGFTTEGRLAAMLIIPSSLGSQRSVIYTPSSIFSGAVAGEKEDFCKGSLSRSIFYLVIVLLHFIFCLHRFIKNTKKLVPL